MYGAQEIDEAQAPDLFAVIRRLAQQARMPMPRVYLIPQETPNAFATGRNPQHAAVAVTEGIMRLLDRDELSGVLAHELEPCAKPRHAHDDCGGDAGWSPQSFGEHGDVGSNVRRRLFQMMTRVAIPSLGLLGILLAPLAATLIQMAISRSRGVRWLTSMGHTSAAILWRWRVRCVRSRRGVSGSR